MKRKHCKYFDIFLKRNGEGQIEKRNEKERREREKRIVKLLVFHLVLYYEQFAMMLKDLLKHAI